MRRGQLAFADLDAGRAARDEALDWLKTRRKQYFHNARVVAMRLVRENGEVTVDTLRDVYPPPPDWDARVLGAVLRDRVFVKIGSTQTARKSSHARDIGIFRLRATS